MVATPGAEPVADGGYAAVVLLDTWLLPGPGRPARGRGGAAALAQRRRPGARRAAASWRSATRPAGPAGAGALGPRRLRRREAEQRRRPTCRRPSRLATVTGDLGALDDVLPLLDLPEGAEVLGPVPVDDEQRVLLRVPRTQGAALSRALGDLQRVRSARKLDPVRIQVDPLSI